MLERVEFRRIVDDPQQMFEIVHEKGEREEIRILSTAELQYASSKAKNVPAYTR